MSGVAVEMNDSALIPRCCEYHSVALEMDLTVRTRWSNDLIVAACVEAIF
jgi:hypothetical protein